MSQILQYLESAAAAPTADGDVDVCNRCGGDGDIAGNAIDLMLISLTGIAVECRISLADVGSPWILNSSDESFASSLIIFGNGEMANGVGVRVKVVVRVAMAARLSSGSLLTITLYVSEINGRETNLNWIES